MTDPRGLPPIGGPLAALCSQLARDLAAAQERIKALEGERDAMRKVIEAAKAMRDRQE